MLSYPLTCLSLWCAPSLHTFHIKLQLVAHKIETDRESEREHKLETFLACRTRRRFPHEFAKQLLIPLTRGHVFLAFSLMFTNYTESWQTNFRIHFSPMYTHYTEWPIPIRRYDSKSIKWKKYKRYNFNLQCDKYERKWKTDSLTFLYKVFLKIYL